MSEESFQPTEPTVETTWSEPSFYRRNKYGLQLEVNQRYAHADAPADPEFPDDVAMNRTSHGLEQERSSDARTTAGQVLGASAMQEVAQAPERAADRYDKIFAAIPRPTVNLSALGPNPGYDYIFEKDEMKYREMERAQHSFLRRRAELLKPQADYDRIVTPAAIQDGEARLASAMSADDTLRNILARYEINATSVDKTRALRENPFLRREVGLYLLSKEDAIIKAAPSQIPARVLSNGEKSPDMTPLSGVLSMRSREYAALLALSMIDGSFNSAKVTDQIVHDTSGKALLGQHRMMALMVLG